MREIDLKALIWGLLMMVNLGPNLWGQRLLLDKYADVQVTRERVRVASAAVLPDKWDKEANWKRIERLVRQAATEGGAELVVTPEGALEGYVINEVNAVANPVERVAAVARFGVWRSR